MTLCICALTSDNSALRRAISSLNYTDAFRTNASTPSLEEDLSDCRSQKSDFALLDLYAGCGGMSTGLCLGAELSGVKLVTVRCVLNRFNFVQPMLFAYSYSFSFTRNGQLTIRNLHVIA